MLLGFCHATLVLAFTKNVAFAFSFQKDVLAEFIFETHRVEQDFESSHYTSLVCTFRHHDQILYIINIIRYEYQDPMTFFTFGLYIGSFCFSNLTQLKHLTC